MNLVLIEDEGIALRKLKKIILEIAPETVILAELESVFDAKIWFQQNPNFSILYFNNRLIVHLKQKTPEKIVISREKANTFKDWLIGK